MAATLEPWQTRVVDTPAAPDIDFSDLIPANGTASAAPAAQPAQPDVSFGTLLQKVAASPNGVQSLSGDEQKALHAHYQRPIESLSNDELQGLLKFRNAGANRAQPAWMSAPEVQQPASMSAPEVKQPAWASAPEIDFSDLIPNNGPQKTGVQANKQTSAPITALSDDELKGLYVQQVKQRAAKSGLQSLSDGELRALHDSISFDDLIPKPNAETYGDPTPWGGLEDRTPEAESLKMSAQYKGPSHALTHGSDYSFDSAVRDLPIAGPALQSDSPELEAWRKAHPGETQALKIGANIVGVLPALAVAPEAFGAGAGQGLAARMGLGAASNAGISAADTAARGGSADDVKRNALVAALIGGGMPGASSAVTASSPLARVLAKNLVSYKASPIPEWMGGDWTEGLAAYLTHGTSEIPLGMMRFAKGTGNAINELRANGMPVSAAPSAERRIAGATINEALARALAKREPKQ